jgi:hypothetical protein
MDTPAFQHVLDSAQTLRTVRGAYFARFAEGRQMTDNCGGFERMRKNAENEYWRACNALLRERA